MFLFIWQSRQKAGKRQNSSAHLSIFLIKGPEKKGFGIKAKWQHFKRLLRGLCIFRRGKAFNNLFCCCRTMYGFKAIWSGNEKMSENILSWWEATNRCKCLEPGQILIHSDLQGIKTCWFDTNYHCAECPMNGFFVGLIGFFLWSETENKSAVNKFLMAG